MKEDDLLLRENWKARYMGAWWWAMPLAVCVLFACSLLWRRPLGFIPFVGAIALVVPALRSQRLLLVLDETHLTIRNPFRTYRIAISDITQVGFRDSIIRHRRRFLRYWRAYRVFVRTGGRRIYINATLFRSYEDESALVDELVRELRARNWRH
jgi:hypothetical protein